MIPIMTEPHKVGLVFGGVFAGMHLVWSLLILLGVAQAFYDFVLWAHMVHMNITIGPFDGTAFVTLIILTAIIGYCVGYIGGRMWNRVYR